MEVALPDDMEVVMCSDCKQTLAIGANGQVLTGIGSHIRGEPSPSVGDLALPLLRCQQRMILSNVKVSIFILLVSEM